MRATPVITGAVLLFALGACGQAADQGASAGGQSSPTTPPSTATTTPPSMPSPTPTSPPQTSGQPQGAVLLPETQLDTSALPSYYVERKVWIINGGRTLQLSGMARDACAGVQAKVVEQNDRLVRVVLSPMDAPQGGPVDNPPICAQVLTPRVVTVDLKAPLGTRKVVVTEEP